jgi:hypothetical protein
MNGDRTKPGVEGESRARQPAHDFEHAKKLEIPGADPRLRSKYGMRRGDTLHIAGLPEGQSHVLYGPYVPLAPGLYKFELRLRVEERGAGRVFVEICHREGDVELYCRACFEWEISAGLIQVSYPLKQAVEDIEVRLSAGHGFQATIEQLAIVRQSPVD